MLLLSLLVYSLNRQQISPLLKSGLPLIQTRISECIVGMHAICTYLGEARAWALPIFHALTGCDITSVFRGKGKKSEWQAWQADEEVTRKFELLATHPFKHLGSDSERIEYSRTCPLTSVNGAREELFCRKSRKMDMIPPTQDAL